MSHMVSNSLDELHAMADKIGVDRKHFQNKSGMPHYDICKDRKRRAISFGAIEVSDKNIVQLLRYYYA